MRFLVLLISVLLHPLFVPTLVLYVLFLTDPFYSMGYGWGQRQAIIQITALATISPGIIFLLFSRAVSRRKLWGNWSLRERSVSLLVIGLLLFEFWYLVSHWGVDLFLQQYFLGIAICLMLLGFISMKFKISIHLAAWGGALAAVLMAFQTHAFFNFPLLCGVIIASALAGFARLYAGAHTLPQVLAGWALGVGVVLGSLVWHSVI